VLCDPHSINALVVGADMIQLDNGDIYRRVDMTDRFERMTDD
jgi:hypothetical protein